MQARVGGDENRRDKQRAAFAVNNANRATWNGGRRLVGPCRASALRPFNTERFAVAAAVAARGAAAIAAATGRLSLRVAANVGGTSDASANRHYRLAQHHGHGNQRRRRSQPLEAPKTHRKGQDRDKTVKCEPGISCYARFYDWFGKLSKRTLAASAPGQDGRAR